MFDPTNFFSLNQNIRPTVNEVGTRILTKIAHKGVKPEREKTQ